MADVQIETVNIKKDVDVLFLSTARSKRGLLFTVKVDKVLEELFQSWANNQANVASNSHGRSWEAAPTMPLPTAYVLGVMLSENSSLVYGAPKPYRLDRLGTPIIDSEGVVNIGFLRMQGISEGAGIQFVIKGVFSREAVRLMSQDIKECVRHFYINFCKPFDVVVRMTTQEI